MNNKETCYKCGSQDNLSIKSRRKSTGYVLKICKSCRNAYYRATRPQIPEVKPSKTEKQVWGERALTSIERISAKYGV